MPIKDSSFLLQRRMIPACRFRVAALSGKAAVAFSLSGIALKLNTSQLSTVSQRAVDSAYCFVSPPFAQLYKYHHESGNAASGKLV